MDPLTTTGIRRALAEVGLPGELRWTRQERQRVKRLVRATASRIGLSGRWLEGTGLAPQDRSRSVEDKVSNWEAFCAELSVHHDLQVLERYGSS